MNKKTSHTKELKSMKDNDKPVKRKRKKAEDKPHYVNAREFEDALIKYYDDGIITNYLGDSIQKIAQGLSYAGNFINYCVDEQTEALTKRGWLNHSEISTDDQIQSYDVKTKQLVWSKIKDIYKGDYDGNMIKLDSDVIDAFVTPNHKFVCQEHGIKPIEEFKDGDNMLTHPNPDFFQNFSEITKKEIYYKGKIWCPSTEYGTFVCRRGKYVYVTGNSYKEDMVGDAVLKMYQAILHKKFKLNQGFSPFGYFTTIAYHAFICRIKKEKKHHEVVEEYKERNFDIMMNDNEEYGSSKVYTRPASIDKIDNY